MLRRFVGNTLNHLMAISLFLMGTLIFINVVLRYVFNSGITWSEEFSRFLFVWMIFLGAIGALKDNQHLGVDGHLKRLPFALRKVFLILSQVLMLVTVVIILIGSWDLTLINMSSKAPATGMSLAFLYGIGIIFSIGMGIIILSNIFKLFKNQNDAKESLDENQLEESEILIDSDGKEQKIWL